MFVKYKKTPHAKEFRPEYKDSLLPTESYMVNPVSGHLKPWLPPLTSSQVKNIELPELITRGNQQIRIKSTEPNKKRELELFENQIESREKKVRDASQKLKLKIAEKTPDTRTGASISPARIRIRGTEQSLDAIQHRSLDVAAAKQVLRQSQLLEQSADQIYAPKTKFKPVDAKNVLLKSRKEDYNENAFDSLSTDIKNFMFNLTQKYVFARHSDTERVQTFARILVNGLYVCKFINKKECLYTPQKVLLPKHEVALVN